MGLLVPSWTDNTEVIAAQALAAGSVVRATLDLRGKLGAYLFPSMGRRSFSGIGTAPRFVLARKGGGLVTSGVRPEFEGWGTSGSAIGDFVDADVAAGATEITTDGVAGFSAGDVISIEDSGLSRVEWNVVAVNSGTSLKLRLPLQYAHTAAQADDIRGQAHCFGPVWAEGGGVYDVVFDHSQGTTAAITVRCLAQVAEGLTL